MATTDLTPSYIARALLDFYGDNPNLWCRGAAARDQRGWSLAYPWTFGACSWCVQSAINLTAKQHEAPIWTSALTVALGKLRDTPSITYWNDRVCKSFDDVKRDLELIAQASA